MSGKASAAVTRSVVCTLPEGGSISVQFANGTGGRTFRRGDAVELDAEATPGHTWREALCEHVRAFAEQGDPKDFWGDGPDQQE